MKTKPGLIGLIATISLLLSSTSFAVGARSTKPTDTATVTATVTATAIFAGGCFWCLEADFEKLPGVLGAESGYTAGRIANPTYEQVSAGSSGAGAAMQHKPRSPSASSWIRADFDIGQFDKLKGRQHRGSAGCRQIDEK